MSNATAYVVMDGDTVLTVVLWAGRPLDGAQRTALARAKGARERPRCLVVDHETLTSWYQLGIGDPGCADCAAVRMDDCNCMDEETLDALLGGAS